MKDKLRLLGIEILYLLSVLIVSTIANPVQFLGKKIISTEGGAVGFGIDYGYNPVAYIAGLYVDFFSNGQLPELPVYQALSLIKLGRPEEGIALARRAKEGFDAEGRRNDSGFFGTTPFFISYLDDPKTARAAFYRRLSDFAATVIDGTSDLF